MDAMTAQAGTHMSEDDVSRMVGLRVRQARILAGLKAGKLADLIGVSRVMQYRYEAGTATIGIWLLPRYAAATEKPIGWLFEDLVGPVAAAASKAMEGTGVTLTPDIVEAVRLFASLPSDKRPVALSTMRAMADTKAE